MRILITGGAGFIGSHLIEAWENEADVLVLDNFRTGYERNLLGRNCRFMEGSIEDRALLDELMVGVDYVFHLAALVSVPESVKFPSECVNLNVYGLLNVLEAAAKAKVRKLVLSSSAAVYGDNPQVPKHEDMLPEPLSPYAITKLDGEYYLDFFRRERGLETVALRFFNVFGPRQDPQGAYAAAVPIFIERALKNEPIQIFGDGGQTRDFVYVKDIVAANRFVADNKAAHGVYNVGYGGSMSINDLAKQIIALTGSRSEIVYQPQRPGDVRHSRASAAKLMALGWNPAHNLKDGLASTIEYFKNLQ
jgi:UDP-glucose 4-epimerase